MAPLNTYVGPDKFLLESSTDDSVKLRVQSEAFRRSVLWLVEFLGKHGCYAQPWASADLPIFSGLSTERRELVLRELNDWIEVLQSNSANFGATSPALPDSFDAPSMLEHRILWRVLNDFKIKFPSDLFSRLPVDSIVEVYTSDSRQIYRSLNFLKICSYSLEEIYSWPWYELYERDESFTRQSMGFLNRAIQGELRGIVNEPLDSHWVAECKAGHSLRTSIQPTMLCFFEDEFGALSGYLYAFRVL